MTDLERVGLDIQHVILVPSDFSSLCESG